MSHARRRHLPVLCLGHVWASVTRARALGLTPCPTCEGYLAPPTPDPEGTAP